MANIVYGTINAGFVALPYACYEVGIPVYIFCVITVAVIAGYTTTMVIKLASDQSSQSGAGGGGGGRGSIPRTLEDLAEIAYGFSGYCVVATLQILLSLTLGCLSLDVWGELSSSILTNRLQNVASSSLPTSLRWFLTNRVGGVLSGSCIVLPLVLRCSTVSSLKWTSYTTIVCIASAFVAVLAAFTSLDDGTADANDDITSSENVVQVFELKSQWWVVCLIVTLCFSYNQKAFSVYSCLRRRSANRWSFAVKRANVLIVCIYALFGVLGYLAHMRKLERFNFFLDFDGVEGVEGSIVFDITRGIVALGLLLTFPMDTLVASTTARRLYRRIAYHRLVQRKSLQGHTYGTSLATDDASLRSALQGTVRMSPHSSPREGGNGNDSGVYTTAAAGAGAGAGAGEEGQSEYRSQTNSVGSALSYGQPRQWAGGTGAESGTASIDREREASSATGVSSITAGGGVDIANSRLGDSSVSNPSSGRSSLTTGTGTGGITHHRTARTDTMTSTETGHTEASLRSESLSSPEPHSKFSSPRFVAGDQQNNTTARGATISDANSDTGHTTNNRSMATSTATNDDNNTGKSKYDEWRLWDRRHASVGDRGEHVHEDVISCCGCKIPAAIPAMLLFWALSVACAVLVQSGVVMAATIGGISTSVMVFVLPSMLYFKLGTCMREYCICRFRKCLLKWVCLCTLIPF